MHVNLTRGLDGEGLAGAHVMKLNYSSLQHAVLPVEGDELAVPLRRPVGVVSLHGQLAPLAWALAAARPGARLGYVQTPGGALPGGHSRTVADLRARGLLAGFLTAGPAFGGEGEAITIPGAVHHGLHDLGWDAAVCGPGPGILGSGSALGHGGMAALDSAHGALALGCDVVLCARMSSGDPRPRHRGLSHHARTVLELLLAPGDRRGATGPRRRRAARPARAHGRRAGRRPRRLRGQRPARAHHGPPLADDPLFFAAALAAGTALAGRIQAS